MNHPQQCPEHRETTRLSRYPVIQPGISKYSYLSKRCTPINLGDDAKHVVRTITARLENEATKDLPERVLMPAVAGR
jgi:hypothetical protein